ncbi:MAG: 5-formyltetrahydrofolate cyclo-ligase [Oscillospiraceae bacterium]|nr:5-formyltetrahydrofolate cyclo-ligase [Oscillospiraceae bacterium]
MLSGSLSGIPAEKQKLRQEIRSRLRDLSPTEKARLDAALLASVTAHPWYREADTLLCYCSLPSEPDTRRLIGEAWKCGKSVALPVCGKPGEMRFYLVSSWEETAAGAFGITEPSGREVPVLSGRTLCLVPALAFTRDGRRLGKGGGYYDRFLAAHPELRTIGLTYAFLLQEDIPCEAHDIGVMEVIDNTGGNHGKS